MRPLDICKSLGSEHISDICLQLNSNQLKTTLRKGEINTRVPSRVVSQRARRKIWARRIISALEAENEAVADSLLYEWLLHHRRNMLGEYLDSIDVKHQGGETEETFTKTVPPSQLLEAARKLASSFPAREVAIYMLYLDHHQQSEVFSTAPEILSMLAGAERADAPE